MAILAASICTHGGKVLVLRQFKDLSKDRITALFANFPLLLSSSGSQNTTVEDESVRYVYQPLEEYYIVLLTNKQSNILQDIDTLHLFVSVVSNMLRTVDEKEIFANAFEILSAFDEIVTLGFREKLTMLQVQSFLEMDSHEEKIQEIIERNKEIEATEERRRKAKEIQRKEMSRREREGTQKMLAMMNVANDNVSQPVNVLYDGPPLGPSMGEAGGYGSLEPVAKEYAAPRSVGGRGLQLGKKPAAKPVSEQRESLLGADPAGRPGAASLSSQAPVSAPSAGRTAGSSSFGASPSPGARAGDLAGQNRASSASPAVTSSAHDGVLITINEKISAQLSREGSVTSSEVKGDLNLRINRLEYARSKIVLRVENNPAVQYKTHPNVDRGLFTSSGEISLKDKSKPFPSNDQSLGVLRWRALGKAEDASLVPIVFTVWVSINGMLADVNIEYELTLDYLSAHPSQQSLENVRVLLPVSLQEVVLKEDSTGQVHYDETEEGVVFTIRQIDMSDPQGNFEFSIPAESEDILFPMEVRLDTTRTENVTESDLSLGKLLVVDVVSNDDAENPYPFTLHQRISCDTYAIN